MSDTVSIGNPIRSRRDEEKEMRRQDILDAAERVIAKHGWENTDFGKIAQRARLSRSLVYVYFPTRDDLFHAVCARGLTDLERRFGTVMATPAPGLELSMSIGRAYHAFAREQPLYFELVAQYQDKNMDPTGQTANEEVANQQGGKCLGLLVQAIAIGLEDGSIDKLVGDPRPAAVSMWAFTHGLIQIASRKECMLQDNFQLSGQQMMEHGFALMRRTLEARK
jgi:AcrR family transcriptional regulator